MASKKRDSDEKDSQASGDKNCKGSQNALQLSGDCGSPCLQDELQNNSRTQNSTDGSDLADPQSSCSQNSYTAKEIGNDKGISILKQPPETSTVPKPQTVQKLPQNQVKRSVPRDRNKQSQKLSSTNQGSSQCGEGLNLISNLIEVEPAKQLRDHTKTDDTSLGKPLKDSKGKGPSSSVSSLSDVFQDGRTEPSKQYIDQKKTDDVSLARSPKDVKRKGSSSSISALSDIIQDIKTSPRDANISAENIPTKGKLTYGDKMCTDCFLVFETILLIRYNTHILYSSLFFSILFLSILQKTFRFSKMSVTCQKTFGSLLVHVTCWPTAYQQWVSGRLLHNYAQFTCTYMAL